MHPSDYENLTPAQSIAYQLELRKRIQIQPLEKPIKIIAGSDISFNKYPEMIGIALRSKKNCNPIYISPGNNISMEQSVDLIKPCIKGYRIPAPTRQAHILVNKIRIENGESPSRQGVLF